MLDLDAATPEPTNGRKIWSVGDLLANARHHVEHQFPLVWVRGEINGFHAHSSGHWYFNLKDQNALLPVAMFRSANAGVAFNVEEGLEVIAAGRVTIYERSGKFQLVCESLEPVGWGALQLAFEQLQERLAAEGLFAVERKRPVPEIPRCVGVVTSVSGAAWHDMTRVWRRRKVAIHTILVHSPVQGREAPIEIAAAIELLNRHPEVEVMIVSRGGGSRQDLWAFNEEVVARAIANSVVPVISAVGHEIDITIADLVADRRAATPTAAAEIVAPSRAELLARADGAMRRLQGSVAQRLLVANRRLSETGIQRALRRPERLLHRYQQRLDVTWSELLKSIERALAGRRARLQTTARQIVGTAPTLQLLQRQRGLDDALQAARTKLGEVLHDRRERLARAAARLEALSPLAVLGRGYAICQDDLSDAILRDPAQVAPGDTVRVRLLRGSLRCSVLRREELDTGA